MDFPRWVLDAHCGQTTITLTAEYIIQVEGGKTIYDKTTFSINLCISESSVYLF